MKSKLTSQENPIALLERVVSGKGDAWRDFVSKYYGVILGMARHFAGGDPDLAEELTVYALEGLKKPGTDGTTFARLRHYLGSLERFGGRSRFLTWLALVVKNIFRDWFRQKSGRLSKNYSGQRATRHQAEAEIQKATELDPERIMDSSPRSHPEQALEVEEGARLSDGLGRELRRALGNLPEKCRQVLVLYYLQGLSGEELRGIMWFSKTQQVYDELARARKILKKEIISKGFTREEISLALEFLRDFHSENILSDFADHAVNMESDAADRTDG